MARHCPMGPGANRERERENSDNGRRYAFEWPESNADQLIFQLSFITRLWVRNDASNKFH